ncbi:MAG: LysM peptidoglycan-binding domain-containing protein [Caldilineaceae bacterium]
MRLNPRFYTLPLIAFILAAATICLTTQPALAQSATHVVQSGDTLANIAAAYGVSTGSLIAANGIADVNHVWVGQSLVIPGASSGSANSWSASSSGGSYVTVQPGDTLAKIAARYGMSAGALMQLNGIANPDHIWVGQQLAVDGGGYSAPAAAPVVATSSGAMHVVQPGETLSQIAQTYGTTMQALLNANGLANADHVWVGQQLVIAGQGSGGYGAAAYAFGPKRIEVDLSSQTLNAWQGDTLVLSTYISSGTYNYPTVQGHFQIYNKLPSQRMYGPGYDIEGVPWVMYFWQDFALHGAFWHNNFGTPMSHGCINLRPDQAEFLYNWADMGTDVYVGW